MSPPALVLIVILFIYFLRRMYGRPQEDNLPSSSGAGPSHSRPADHPSLSLSPTSTSTGQSLIPSLQPEFFTSDFYRRFHVQRECSPLLCPRPIG